MLLALDTSSIEGGPPFSAEPHRRGITDGRQWEISLSAITGSPVLPFRREQFKFGAVPCLR